MTGQSDIGAAETVQDQALAWLVRVQSDAATADDWSALADWLEGAPERLAAFEAAELSVAGIDDVAPAIAEGLAAPVTNVLPFARRRLVPSPRWIGALAAACLVLVAGPILWQAAQGREITYRTAPGETRDVVLADGSHIRMGGASQLTARLGWRARRVSMADAEATFDVTKDPKRPFVIKVGDQQVRVVGTQFNIRHREDRVVVTVRRGVVEVRQPGLGPAPIARLTVGDQLSHRVGTTTSEQSRVDPAVAFAWTEGRLVCQDRLLSDIVADLNRRYARPFRLAGDAGDKRFSGVLELGDQDVLARRLAGYLSLTVERSDQAIILR
ncbi:MAG: DUF4880 domain-containing protein [Caulobacter sp.]|nr:DUF4880 domain-containing protein [Caulobacter sp.]